MKSSPDDQPSPDESTFGASSPDDEQLDVLDQLRLEIAELRAECKAIRDVGYPWYLTINQVCVRYATSRSTVHRMIDDPELGLSELIIRVPPGTGPQRIPAAALEKIFMERRRRRGTNRGRDE